MRIELNEMTVNSEKVKYSVLRYMERVSQYERFNPCQLCHVYVDSNKDFIGFDSKDYAISYLSNDHKLLDAMNSRYSVADTPFNEIRQYISAL